MVLAYGPGAGVEGGFLGLGDLAGDVVRGEGGDDVLPVFELPVFLVEAGDDLGVAGIGGVGVGCPVGEEGGEFEFEFDAEG